MHGNYTRNLMNAQRWQRCFDRDAEREQNMRNHPATKAREARESAERGAGAAILEALEGGNVLERPDVYALGARQRVIPATTRAPERTYTLDGFAHRPDGGPSTRFYVLSGGASSARTVLSGVGEPIAHAERTGRGLSLAFRNWIARAVVRDLELCGF